MTLEISIEVVFATPDSQLLVNLKLPSDAIVADAITKSGLAKAFPQHALGSFPVGIWGTLADLGQTLQDGDRVEIYRELEMDPMEARRLRASEPVPDPFEPR